MEPDSKVGVCCSELAMNRLAAALTAALVGMLALSGVAATFAVELGADDRACTGQAPFREVAQDEVYTFDERCSMRDEFGADRGRTGVEGIGWAKTSRPLLPRKH
jgi:hypothetical protein